MASSERRQTRSLSSSGTGLPSCSGDEPPPTARLGPAEWAEQAQQGKDAVDWQMLPGPWNLSMMDQGLERIDAGSNPSLDPSGSWILLDDSSETAGYSTEVSEPSNETPPRYAVVSRGQVDSRWPLGARLDRAAPSKSQRLVSQFRVGKAAIVSPALEAIAVPSTHVRAAPRSLVQSLAVGQAAIKKPRASEAAVFIT